MCTPESSPLQPSLPLRAEPSTLAASAAQSVGIAQEAFAKQPFWELFEMPCARDCTPWLACRDVASRGGEFVIHGVRVRGTPERRPFTMRFRYVTLRSAG